MKVIHKVVKIFIEWCKDYKSDFKKIIFSFLMGYSSVIVVILILKLNNQQLFGTELGRDIIFSILGCSSSMLAVASVTIEKNNTSLKTVPMLFNILAILPIFGFMSYFLIDSSVEINTKLLFTIAILGVILSFHYLVISTNEERTKRKKYENDSKKLRNESEKETTGTVAGKEIEV